MDLLEAAFSNTEKARATKRELLARVHGPGTAALADAIAQANAQAAADRGIDPWKV